MGLPPDPDESFVMSAFGATSKLSVGSGAGFEQQTPIYEDQANRRLGATRGLLDLLFSYDEYI